MVGRGVDVLSGYLRRRSAENIVADGCKSELVDFYPTYKTYWT